MYDGPERRQRQRVSVKGVTVFLKKRGWRCWFSRPERIEAVDFNAGGIGFDTRQHFVPGEQVWFYIKIEATELMSVVGIIRHVTSLGKEGRYRVGSQLDVLGIGESDKEKLNTLWSRIDVEFGGS